MENASVLSYRTISYWLKVSSNCIFKGNLLVIHPSKMLEMCRKLSFYRALVEPFGKICFAGTPIVQSAQFSTRYCMKGPLSQLWLLNRQWSVV